MSWQLEKIEFHYPGKPSEPVFCSLSGRIDRCKSLGISGANGSGKTTLIKLLLGLLMPTAGRITLEGTPLNKIPLWEIGRKTGNLMQNPRRQLFACTVYEELLFPFELTGEITSSVKDKADELLTLFGLQGKSSISPHMLSRGEQQRLALAAVLMHNPDYLILDEPTSSLDQENRQVLLEILTKWRQNGNGLLIVSHDKMLLDNLCEHQYHMKTGWQEGIWT